MKKLETKLHCDVCETGIVTLVVTEKARTINAFVKGCNNPECKKEFGLKSVSTLKQV